jgi:hypothetical protein
MGSPVFPLKRNTAGTVARKPFSRSATNSTGDADWVLEFRGSTFEWITRH